MKKIINTKYLLIFLFLALKVTASLAAETCYLNGQWYQRSDYGNWDFTQDMNGKVHGEFRGNESAKACGRGWLDGTNINNVIELEGGMENAAPGCVKKITVNAHFTNCQSITGTYQKTFSDGKVEDNELTMSPETIHIVSPVRKSTFIIDETPKMPEITARAEITQSYSPFLKSKEYIPPIIWQLNISSRVPRKYFANTLMLDYEAKENDLTFHPDFDQLPGLRGGDLIFIVKYFLNEEDVQPYYIIGTNPGKALIETVLTDKTAQGLACVESRWKQFKANREGGTGKPVIGWVKRNNKLVEAGGVGIMQIYNPKPTADDVWNWRANIKHGIAILNQKRKYALGLNHRELIRINSFRKEKGLSLCSKDSIPPLNAEQLEREVIREYNGSNLYKWTGVETDNCKGEWIEIKPAGRQFDPDYVNKFFTCDIDK